MKRLLFIGLMAVCGQVMAQKDTAFIEKPDSMVTKTGTIYGTLCTPIKFTKIPVVLIIAGSGPTDRDGNNPMGMKTDAYKIIAHRLSSNGIASVRYDKRAIAASAAAGPKEADLNFNMYIDDAKGWVELLKADKRFSKVIVIGHSEGSLIGMNASDKDVSKFISISGAGMSAGKILKAQIAESPTTGLSQGLKDTAYMGIDSLEAGKRFTNYPQALAMFFRPSVQPYLISWFIHDPQVDIKKLDIPVLILQGTSDLQVDTNSAENLKKAYPKAKLVLIKGMNHVLRDVGTDKTANMLSYSDPTKPMDEELLKEIVDFIKK
jgi:pimeloyl-ACP methyl ester carboxylesterase